MKLKNLKKVVGQYNRITESGNIANIMINADTGVLWVDEFINTHGWVDYSNNKNCFNLSKQLKFYGQPINMKNIRKQAEININNWQIYKTKKSNFLLEVRNKIEEYYFKEEKESLTIAIHTYFKCFIYHIILRNADAMKVIEDNNGIQNVEIINLSELIRNDGNEISFITVMEKIKQVARERGIEYEY